MMRPVGHVGVSRRWPKSPRSRSVGDTKRHGGTLDRDRPFKPPRASRHAAYNQRYGP